MALDQRGKTAILYRMVMPDHLCPYGLKSKDLLERQGFAVEDRHLKTHDETEAFKAEHGVETTPQTFIAGKRIGGYDDLRRHFGLKVTGEGEASYRPVVAIFSVAFLMALAVNWCAFGTVIDIRVVELFIAIGMCLLAIQKLQDGLCCTYRVRDSSCESSVVAGRHEQTHPPRLQDQELARL